MTVFIQDLMTSLYFRSPGVWVERIDEAASFHDCEEAVRSCVGCRLEEVRIVMREEKTGMETYIFPSTDT